MHPIQVRTHSQMTPHNSLTPKEFFSNPHIYSSVFLLSSLFIFPYFIYALRLKDDKNIVAGKNFMQAGRPLNCQNHVME